MQYANCIDEDGYFRGFGHVYIIVKNGDISILVDPTYMQFVAKENRKNLPPLMLFSFKNNKEFREKISSFPIKKEKMILPFYFGFNSPEAKQLTEVSGGGICSVISDDVMRIDNSE